MAEQLMFKGDNWYDWNVRNWGTKWDVAVHDGDKYPETEITDENDVSIGYRFNTAWSPPIEVISVLAKQYPNCTFSLGFEEETGWGGEVEFNGEEMITLSEYTNKCRDCDAENTMDYCENECGEICDSCHWLGEADLEAVAECDTHKVFLDDEHVPDYRKVEA
jgi:hypothetical protein